MPLHACLWWQRSCRRHRIFWESRRPKLRGCIPKPIREFEIGSFEKVASVRMSSLITCTNPALTGTSLSHERDVRTTWSAPGERRDKRNDGICDSRQYRLGYQIDFLLDFPKDFGILEQTVVWRKAIFIPGIRQDGLRKTRDLPRIYVLTLDRLMVYAHPASGEPPFVAPLDELIELSSHKAGHLGTVGFSTVHATGCFRYEAAHQKLMNSLMTALRSAWLPFHAVSNTAFDTAQLNPPLDARCRYALELELDSRESILGIYPQTQQRRKALAWLQHGERPCAASYIVFTNRRIVTVISSEGRANGVMICYAPLSDARDEEIEWRKNSFCLQIRFGKDRVWRICVASTQISAIDNITELLRRSRRLSKTAPLRYEDTGVSNALCAKNISR